MLTRGPAITPGRSRQEARLPEGHDSRAGYMAWVQADAATRTASVRNDLLQAFERFIERCEVETINFSSMTAIGPAAALFTHPLILRPLLACCNLAGRAIERDLDIRNVDTYEARLNQTTRAAIAGYLKPFLPQEIAVPALRELDPVLLCRRGASRAKGAMGACSRRVARRRPRPAVTKIPPFSNGERPPPARYHSRVP